MIETLLQNLDTLLLLLFAHRARWSAAALMIVLRQPMRVAMALISTMVFLGGIYGLLGVHFIAAFQVLIYVGAVMVFMVYVIMLLEVRESEGRRYSGLLRAGRWSASCCSSAPSASASGAACRRTTRLPATRPTASRQFSISFLNDYWLHFELTSVLLVAAVVAALAVIRVSRRADEARRHG